MERDNPSESNPMTMAFLSSNVPAGAILHVKIAFLSSNMPTGAFSYLKNNNSDQ